MGFANKPHPNVEPESPLFVSDGVWSSMSWWTLFYWKSRSLFYSQMDHVANNSLFLSVITWGVQLQCLQRLFQDQNSRTLLHYIALLQMTAWYPPCHSFHPKNVASAWGLSRSLEAAPGQGGIGWRCGKYKDDIHLTRSMWGGLGPLGSWFIFLP